MKNQKTNITGVGPDNHAITANGTHADFKTGPRDLRKRKLKHGVVWLALTFILWLGSSVCAGEFKIWEQRRFKKPVEVTHPHVCDVGARACPRELGGWAMGELAFRFNYSRSGKFRQAKSLRLVVRTDLFTPMAVVVKVGNTKIGGFRAKPGQKIYEVSIPKRLLRRAGSNIRLITPAADVGYGNDFKGLNLQRVTLYGLN